MLLNVDNVGGLAQLVKLDRDAAKSSNTHDAHGCHNLLSKLQRIPPRLYWSLWPLSSQQEAGSSNKKESLAILLSWSMQWSMHRSRSIDLRTATLQKFRRHFSVSMWTVNGVTVHVTSLHRSVSQVSGIDECNSNLFRWSCWLWERSLGSLCLSSCKRSYGQLGPVDEAMDSALGEFGHSLPNRHALA